MAKKTTASNAALPADKTPTRRRLNQAKRVVENSAHWRKYKKFAKTPQFANGFKLLSVVTLLLTTLLWAYWGARLHMGNADQLVDPYLFHDRATFAGAQFPGAHTFILKWPLFVIIRLLGYSPVAFIVTTMTLALVPVAALTYAMYRNERRPLYFGTLCLALASVLLLVPAQPYAGALLPVNFAMLATRNLEYVVYIGCLYAYAKSSNLRSKWFIVSTVGLAVLIASDKLFLTLSIGGALLMLVGYALAQSIHLVGLAARWLLGTVTATILASGLLKILSWSHITNIIGDNTANPYGFIDNGKDLVLGVYYGFTNMLTNFGANPAYDATQPLQIFSSLARNVTGSDVVSYVLNIIILAVVIRAVWKSVQNSFKRRTTKAFNRQLPGRLLIMLFASSLIISAVFVATKHYYAVDARYLTIWLFTGFIALSLQLKKRKFSPAAMSVIGGVLFIGILLSLPARYGGYVSSLRVNMEYEQRNTQVSSALQNHEVTTLVGDYWRVVPIRNQVKNVAVSPLANCSQPRNTLTSTVWNRSLHNRAFAYLVSLDKAQTDFPSCSIDQITSIYGRPNSSLLIAGSFEDPKELLLFYDNGLQPKAPTAISFDRAVGSVAPIDITSVPNTACFAPTIMNIVAHQDDDLLFLSPDLLHSIKAGNCVRTIYLTAGDSGYGQYYWASRQQGAEAAYSAMLGTSDVWVQRIVKLAAGRYLTISSPRTNPKISLIFMNLPDGNLRGTGFESSFYQSLSKLREEKFSSLKSVDGQSEYSSENVVGALSMIMQLYQPAEIRTLSSLDGTEISDHSDHTTTRWYADQARLQYLQAQYKNAVNIPISYYIGYPTRERPTNVFGDDFELKEMAFLTYAKFDGGVCNSKERCNETPTYGSYLGRQYRQDP